MIDSGTATLTAAWNERRAIGAFSVYNLEGLIGVVDAAEAARRPVIVQIGSSAFGYAPRPILAAMALAAAAESTVPVGVHLDHSRDLDEIAACLALGYTSVMFDGSHLAFDENVRLTRMAVQMAHDAGAWIEGELGEVGGDEDRSGAVVADAACTDPRAAAEFASATGVDALAVAVGNVHGVPPPGMRLDVDRLAAIAALCPVPLVLHGASGVDDADLSAAVERGVVKVNVNTELRIAFLSELATADPAAHGYSFPEVMSSARAALRDIALSRIRLFAGLRPAARD